MITPYRFHTIPGNPALGLGVYLPILAGGALFGTTRLIGESPVPIPCTLRNVIMRIGAPGGVTAREFQLQINSVTVATWTFSGSTAEVRDLNDYNLVADDRVTLVYTAQTGTPANLADLLLAFEIETESPHERKSLYWSHNALFDSGTPRYHHPFDSASADSNAWTIGSEAARTGIAPINGSIVGYYTRIRTGVTAMNGSILINKNTVAQDGTGATVDTRQLWSGAQAANTTFNRFTEFNLPFVVGDRLVFREDKVSGGTASGHMCVVVEATTEGESICATGDKTSAPATNAAEYNSPTNSDETGYSGPTDVAAEVMGNITPFSLGRMHVGLATTPGAGNSRLVTTHLNGVDTALTVTITDADTANASPLPVAKADTTHSVAIVDGDRWSFVTTGVSIPAATAIDVAWSQYIAPPPPAAVLVTQLGVLLFTDRFADADIPEEADPCTGGGTVASGTDPSAGVSLRTSRKPQVWIEVTPDGGTTVRIAKSAINHGPPKKSGVKTFGRLHRRLTDSDGGPRRSSMSVTVIDNKRLLRDMDEAGVLERALVEVFAADLDTLRSGGAPERLFRGRVAEPVPLPDMLYELPIEDELTSMLSSLEGEDLRIPQALVEDTLVNEDPTSPLYQAPIPQAYGSVSDEALGDDALGRWELKYLDTQIIPGMEAKGALDIFLGVDGAVAEVQSMFGADLFETPPTSRQKLVDAAYDDFIWIATKPGWSTYFPDPWFEDANGRRLTVALGLSNHPIIREARLGRVPLLMNFCATETVGDGSGNTIDSPARAFLNWFNNRVVQQATANWLTIATLGDYSLFKTSTFEAVHAICTALALKVSGVIGYDFTQQSWRDRIAEWCRFGFDLGTARSGQQMLTMLDPSDDAADAPELTERYILERGCRTKRNKDRTKNIIRYVFNRNYRTALQNLNQPEGERAWREPYDAEWLSGLQKVTNASSITDLGGPPKGERTSDVQEYTLISDTPTATTVATAYRDLWSPPRGRIEVEFDLSGDDGWDLELGDIRKVSHRDLPWTGFRRCQVRELTIDLDQWLVTVVARDVDDLLA